MKLSKRGEYALRALIDLGISQELGRPLLQISELVEKEKLPEKFLVQILVQMREAGIIESKRGKHGGYSLARPMDSINFGYVIRLIDGPLAPIACCSQTAYAPCTCPDEEHCGLRMLMLDVRNAIANVLDRHTLADIVDVTLRKLRRDNASFHLGEIFGGMLEISDPDVELGKAVGRSQFRWYASTGTSGRETSSDRSRITVLFHCSSFITPSMREQTRPETERLRATYVAFNARNIDAALAGMTPDVTWPKAF